MIPSLLITLLAVSAATSGDQSTWTDLGGGHPGNLGVPQLVVTGDAEPGAPISLELTGAKPLAPAFLVVGLTEVQQPLLGGLLIPSPTFILQPKRVDPSGNLTWLTHWPATAPSAIDLYYQYWVLDPSASQGATASNGMKSSPSPAPEAGTLPTAWINGTDCATEANTQVHKYNDDFYIIRQSVCTNFEAPFLYLIFGEDRALLLDSGANGQVGLTSVITGLVATWAADHGKVNYPLTVAHTHGHGDHTTGDSNFQGLPNTTVVGTNANQVQSFFGFTNWPEQLLTYDLGNRIIDLIPTPGHEDAHLVFYDRRTDNMMTGDTLYPGRIYIFSTLSQGTWPVFQASMQRLADFTMARDVNWLLGAHIEMTTTPGVDYAFGASSHPNEHVLQLEPKHIVELNSAAQAMGSNPKKEVHADFIIFPSN
ncbi:MAG: hydroxyacylglutathione hydrolase [Planctomycetota bacterium]|jgi:hydroxyacylglutathione hydrolase